MNPRPPSVPKRTYGTYGRICRFRHLPWHHWGRVVHAQPKLKERNFLADVRLREARCSVREERVGVREEKVPAINGAAVSLAATVINFSYSTVAVFARVSLVDLCVFHLLRFVCSRVL